MSTGSEYGLLEIRLAYQLRYVLFECKNFRFTAPSLPHSGKVIAYNYKSRGLQL